MKQRKADVLRKTKETKVSIGLNLDKPVPVKVRTTVPFVDHMLTLLAHHAAVSLIVEASGDTEIDDHHLVEDIGITLGQALKKALGSKKSINRYGNFLLPMDEALSYVAIDISGRPYLDYKVKYSPGNRGFDFGLFKEFFYAVAINGGLTLHIKQKSGENNHHIAESVFKGFGRALRQAVALNNKQKGVPSTKGKL